MYRVALSQDSHELPAPVASSNPWRPFPCADPETEEVDTFLYYNREDIIAMFYELKEEMAFHGLMANSRPEELTRIVLESCEFAMSEPPTSSSEDEDDDDMDAIIDLREHAFDYI